MEAMYYSKLLAAYVRGYIQRNNAPLVNKKLTEKALHELNDMDCCVNF